MKCDLSILSNFHIVYCFAGKYQLSWRNTIIDLQVT